MIQAFYSRSTMSIVNRLEVLGDTEDKIKSALRNTYIGYGHESVGEMGYITVFFEGISMLAAKAIQDNQLYVGQESSTRYIDFANQPMVIPADAENPNLFKDIQGKLREFYVDCLPAVVDEIKRQFPYNEDVDKSIYNKTVKARAFDIMRGFLPAGSTTNVAWTGNFRIIGRHLIKLMSHPLLEIRELAGKAYSKLIIDYPNSFRKLNEKDFNKKYSFYSLELSEPTGFSATNYGNSVDLSKEDGDAYRFFDLICSDRLDFGSYRDLQRHRRLEWVPPLLTTQLGFNEFYLQNIPVKFLGRARELLSLCDGGNETKENKQYLLPMGYNVNILMKFNVTQALYMAKLRSSKTVHPTLRIWAQKLGRFLKEEYNLDAGVDYNEDNWTLKRGAQDIIKKIT